MLRWSAYNEYAREQIPLPRTFSNPARKMPSTCNIAVTCRAEWAVRAQSCDVGVLKLTPVRPSSAFRSIQCCGWSSTKPGSRRSGISRNRQQNPQIGQFRVLLYIPSDSFDAAVRSHIAPAASYGNQSQTQHFTSWSIDAAFGRKPRRDVSISCSACGLQKGSTPSAAARGAGHDRHSDECSNLSGMDRHNAGFCDCRHPRASPRVSVGAGLY